MNFRCTTNNCEFNLRNKCNASAIDINKKCVCDTKIKRRGGAYAQAIAEFEIADELVPNVTDTTVYCHANECIHNDCGKCACKNLVVGDSLVKTKCFSQTKKAKEK